MTFLYEDFYDTFNIQYCNGMLESVKIKVMFFNLEREREKEREVIVVTF